MESKGIFVKEEVNTGRQPELDLAKAVVIFFLATIHVYVECSTDAQLWTGLPYFFDSVLGGPWAAPMFIFSMGIGLAYTKESGAGDLFRRGIHVAIVGLLLNVCRFLVPSFVGWMITGDDAMYIDRLPYRFFGNDLLQFAALAMLFMALLKYFAFSPWKIWFVALIVNIAALFLNDTYLDSMVLNIILGHFIGIDNGTEIVMSDFPVLIWFLLYASGHVFGGYLRRLNDKKKFYRWVSLPCLALTTVVYIVEYKKGFGMMGGPGANVFYHFYTPELFLCILTEFAMLGIYYKMIPHLSRKALNRIESVSRNVTVVYCIQWTLVWWAADVILYIAKGSKYLAAWQSLLLGLSLSTASVVLAGAWEKIKLMRNTHLAR